MGPKAADYTIACVNSKEDFTTSLTAGEGDCLTIFVRQRVGDAAGILSNVLSVQGFAATIESEASNFERGVGTTKSINTQLGVVDSVLNLQHGLVLNARIGTGLTAGLRIQNETGASWAKAVSIASGTTEIFSIDGGSGAIFTAGTLSTASSIGVAAGTSGPAAVQIGVNRVSDGPSYVDLYATGPTNTPPVSAYSARILRDAGAGGALTITNTGAGGVAINSGDGNTSVSVGGVPTVIVSSGGANVGGTLGVTGNAGFQGGLSVAGSMSVGTGTSSIGVIQIAPGRTQAGPSYIDMYTDTGGVVGTRIIRAAGADGNLDITNGGTGNVYFGTAGQTKVALAAGGIGFNGSVPIAKPVLAPALPTDGSASGAQLATAYNSLRAAMISYGLAQ